MTDLKALDAAATQGVWEAGSNKGRVLALFTRADRSSFFWDILSGSPLRFASDDDGSLVSAAGTIDANAAFIAALVNAYRAGELVPRHEKTPAPIKAPGA